MLISRNNIFISGIDETNATNMMIVYPNPTGDKIIFEGDIFGSINIYNLCGSFVYQALKTGNKVEVNTSGFSNGVYFWHCGSKTGKVFIQH